jgi:hypothetical protein
MKAALSMKNYSIRKVRSMKHAILIFTLTSAILFAQTNTGLADIESGEMQNTNTAPSYLNMFSADASLSLMSRRVWRGMDLNGANEPSLSAGGSITFLPAHITLQSEFVFALINRHAPYDTQTSDRLLLRLFGEWRFFGDGLLAVTPGATLYRNVYYPAARYAALTMEGFVHIAFPDIFLAPALKWYYDFTPAQSGIYWVLEARHTFNIFNVPLATVFSYGHAGEFMRQHNFRLSHVFQNPLYILTAIIPSNIGLSAAAAIEVNDWLTVMPYSDWVLLISDYMNRETLEIVFGVTLSAHFNTEDVPFLHFR